MKELFIRIARKKVSYVYKRWPDRKDDWFNNDWHNMLDDFILYADEEQLFSAKCQTVANIPGGRFADTIAAGSLKIKAFVENRNFYGRIHGICEAFDLEGQFTDAFSVQVNDKSRWLVHDTQSLKPKPPMQLTRVAWGAGCFVMSPSNLVALGDIFDAYKIMPGEMIDGELIEEV
jgi:hypothetical protein